VPAKTAHTRPQTLRDPAEVGSRCKWRGVPANASSSGVLCPQLRTSAGRRELSIQRRPATESAICSRRGRPSGATERAAPSLVRSALQRREDGARWSDRLPPGRHAACWPPLGIDWPPVGSSRWPLTRPRSRRGRVTASHPAPYGVPAGVPPSSSLDYDATGEPTIATLASTCRPTEVKFVQDRYGSLPASWSSAIHEVVAPPRIPPSERRKDRR
jgi:hypothetical protein